MCATFGYVEFGMATPSYGQLYFGGVYVPATNTGWVHVTIPLNPATNPNLLKINNVMVHIWGGTSLVGASTLWVDNLKFTGTTVTDTATVNYAVSRQLIDGFGASSAWGSTWSTAEADLFFSTGPNGVGLSLLRSRIAPEGTTVETEYHENGPGPRRAGVEHAVEPARQPEDLQLRHRAAASSQVPANYQTYANQLANYVAVDEEHVWHQSARPLDPERAELRDDLRVLPLDRRAVPRLRALSVSRARRRRAWVPPRSCCRKACTGISRWRRTR